MEATKKILPLQIPDQQEEGRGGAPYHFDAKIVIPVKASQGTLGGHAWVQQQRGTIVYDWSL